MNNNTTTVSLQHLSDKARLAHYGTSFSPEKRGEQMIKDYEELLISDLEQIKDAPAEVINNYKERFISHLTHYMGAKSRCISPMIAGPSNFPTERMKKYNNWEDSAYNKFQEFREKALKAICKKIEADKPEQQKQDETWARIEKGLLSSIQTIIDIDNGINTYSARQLFVSSITGLIKRMAKNGQTYHVKKAIELIQQVNSTSKKPIITPKNSIFNLMTTAEAIEETKADNKNKESDIYKFDGGEVHINYQDERIQLKYDAERVPYDLYKKLTKELHFRHSRQNNAFQLYINNQSIHKVNQFLGITIPYIN